MPWLILQVLKGTFIATIVTDSDRYVPLGDDSPCCELKRSTTTIITPVCDNSIDGLDTLIYTDDIEIWTLLSVTGEVKGI